MKIVFWGTPKYAAENLIDIINADMEVIAVVTHGVLSGNAVKSVENSKIEEMVLTDTILAASEVKNEKKIRHITIAPLFGEAIKRINSNSSISELFD